jgi:glycosyltransferase involved in cell wall biosynthesis
LELNLYGTGLWEKGLQRLANQLRLFNVHFRGHQEDVAGIWQDNHMLVLPSRYEGLPLALVEAMWCARPAVVTDIGGNAELCLDEQTGFVAAAPEVTLLEQTLERAWTRRHEWEALGKSSRRRVEQLVPTDPIQEFCSHLTANPQ